MKWKMSFYLFPKCLMKNESLWNEHFRIQCFKVDLLIHHPPKKWPTLFSKYFSYHPRELSFSCLCSSDDLISSCWLNAAALLRMFGFRVSIRKTTFLREKIALCAIIRKLYFAQNWAFPLLRYLVLRNFAEQILSKRLNKGVNCINCTFCI